jgi:altronate dehydratase small subunit
VTVVPALVISSSDNVATALQPLEAGQVVVIGGQSITIAESTPKGHKIALRLIRAGEQVMKYGSTIGTATCDIEPGAHVHTHNVASGRGRGDLGRRQTRNNTDEEEPRQNAEADGSAPDEPRLAEPPDLSPITGKTAQ